MVLSGKIVNLDIILKQLPEAVHTLTFPPFLTLREKKKVYNLLMLSIITEFLKLPHTPHTH